MVSILKSALKKLGLYYRVRDGRLGRLYKKIKPDIYYSAIITEEKLFDQALLGENTQLIFDVGANAGHTTDYFRRRSKKVVAIEPVPENCIALKSRFKNFANVNIEEAAVTDKERELLLFISDDSTHCVSTVNEKWKHQVEAGGSKDTDIKYRKTIKVKGITLAMLEEKYGSPDYIKLDIEGHEYPVIASLKKSVPVISFETHFPSFHNETERCMFHLIHLAGGEHILFNATTNDSSLVFEQYITPEMFSNWLFREQPSYCTIFCKSH
jgi:FkbM family methyltransferase